MSDLLQQAIIDATALKEAAIKNAENLLVEKYSQEFKQTVEKLLEQEQIQTPAPQDPAQQAAPVDPMQQNATTGDPSMTATPTDATGDKKDAFSKVSAAFLDDGDENELITINFDQLKNTMMEMLGHKETELDEVYDRSTNESHSDPTMDSLGAGVASAALEEELEEEELELDEEWDELEEVNSGPEAQENLEEFELEEMTGVATGAVAGTPAMPAIKNPDKAAAATKNLTGLQSRLAGETAKINTQIAGAQRELASAQEPVKTTLEEEEMELSEEELAELEEAIRVDIQPKKQGRGQMGTTEGEVEKQRDMELAAAQDDEAKEKREEEKRKMEELVKENLQVKSLNNKLLSTLETLKEQAEKMNLSNAKLLYTNKALANISLNERQKNQIVESISKADSVLAAKTIYETIQNAVENNVQKEAPQSLRETLNRSATPFAVKKTAANSLPDLMAERMKALAGIKHTK